MKNRITVLPPIVVALACSALAPVAHATPPPKSEDRGNGNSAAEGVQALNLGTTGSDNTAHGWFSLSVNITGSDNTATGRDALLGNSSGNNNTATGRSALRNNSSGNDNTAMGFGALASNSTGSPNTAVGSQALYNNSSGTESTAIGYQALFSDISGGDNTAIGHRALYNNTAGVLNTAVGADSLVSNTEGVLNTAIGIGAGGSVTTASNVICIGAFVAGADVDNSCFIGQIRGVATQHADAVPVLIDSAGQLGTASSSRRFKKEINPMGKASESILNLKPVMFSYKSDKTNTPQFGLVAEQVAEVNPDLIVRDAKGEIYTVRYDAVNAMLLNEFLKEHKKVENQQSKIEEQQKQINAVTAQLKQQAAQIQKVSAQIEISRPAPRTVINNR
jgi:hypothetical protein